MRYAGALKLAQASGVLVLPASEQHGGSDAEAAWMVHCVRAAIPTLVCYRRRGDKRTATSVVHGAWLLAASWPNYSNAERWSIATETFAQISGQALRHQRGSHRRTFVRLRKASLTLDGIRADELATTLHTLRAAVYDWCDVASRCPTVDPLELAPKDATGGSVATATTATTVATTAKEPTP